MPGETNIYFWYSCQMGYLVFSAQSVPYLALLTSALMDQHTVQGGLGQTGWIGTNRVDREKQGRQTQAGETGASRGEYWALSLPWNGRNL